MNVGSPIRRWLSVLSSSVFSSSSSLKKVVKLYRIDDFGRLRDVRMTIDDLKHESRLHTRELLMLDQPKAPHQPRLLPRRHCIITSVGHVRSLVFTDRVYLFNPSVPQVQQYAKSLAAHICAASMQQYAVGATKAAGPVVDSGAATDEAHAAASDDDASWSSFLNVPTALNSVTIQREDAAATVATERQAEGIDASAKDPAVLPPSSYTDASSQPQKHSKSSSAAVLGGLFDIAWLFSNKKKAASPLEGTSATLESIPPGFLQPAAMASDSFDCPSATPPPTALLPPLPSLTHPLGISYRLRQQQKGAAGASDREQSPFEIMVLEHILMTTYTRQAKRVAYASHVMDYLLSKISSASTGRDEGSWAALFPLANTLNHYEMVSRGLMECVRALLDDDRDMRETLLTEKAKIAHKVVEKARALARSHASAYDPVGVVMGRSGGEEEAALGLQRGAGESWSDLTGAAMMAASSSSSPSLSAAHHGEYEPFQVLRELSPRSQILCDGSLAYLGHASSPISSFKYVKNLMASTMVPPFTTAAAASAAAPTDEQRLRLLERQSQRSARLLMDPTPQDDSLPADELDETAQIEMEDSNTMINNRSNNSSSREYSSVPVVDGLLGATNSEVGLPGSGSSSLPSPRSPTLLPSRGRQLGAPTFSVSAPEEEEDSHEEMGAVSPRFPSGTPDASPRLKDAAAAAPSRPHVQRLADDEDEIAYKTKKGAPTGRLSSDSSSVIGSGSAAAASRAPQSLRFLSDDDDGTKVLVTASTAGRAGGGEGGGGALGVGGELPPILRVPTDSLSQLELMLESIFHRAEENTMSIVELSKSLANKQSLMELQQSNHRNFILLITLRMAVVSASIGGATFLTSLYGMNVTNGFEGFAPLAGPPFVFIGLLASSLSLGALSNAAINKYVAIDAPSTSYARRLQTFQDFLLKLDSQVDSVKNALHVAASSSSSSSGSNSSSSGVPLGLDRTTFGEDAGTAPPSTPPVHRRAEDIVSLDKKGFKALYERYTGRHLSSEETDLLFELMDANGDGQLQIEDIAGLFQKPRGGDAD